MTSTASETTVPFVDLSAQHAPLIPDMLDAIAGVVQSGHFVQGPHAKNFEAAFAAYCEAREALAVTNGTAALELALKGLGVGPGDEVVSVAATFFATAEAIANVGATPVFVDVDPVSYTMDPALIADAVTDRTKAVVPVDLYGHAADIAAIRSVTDPLGLPVLEDAAQAHGGRRDGRRVGSMATVTSFSFYPSKNLGALGEGGGVVSSNPELAARMRSLRNHGYSADGSAHDLIGHNFRMDEIHAATLGIKLPHLDGWNEQRRRVVSWYEAALAGVEGVELPGRDPSTEHVYHLYVVKVPDRVAIRRALAERGVSTGLHYPAPVHLTPAFAHLGYEAGAMPVTEDLFSRGVSLPIFPGMTESQVTRVADALKAAVTALAS